MNLITDLFPHAMPLNGFLGGLMIGAASALMLLGLGRIAGISGLTAQATGLSHAAPPAPYAVLFVAGLPLGGLLVALFLAPPDIRMPTSTVQLVLAGLLVGFGTRLGAGCTSGHGVCGLSRFSPRSAVATLVFMASGFATVAVMRFSGLIGG